MYDVGDQVVLSTTLTDPDSGLLLDAATVQLTVTPPAGPVVVITGADIEHDSPGSYRASHTAAVAGAHRYAWSGTGPMFAESGVFQVWPPLTVMSLADAKDHLNVEGTEKDDELRRNIIAATDAIENKTGPLTPIMFSERLSAWPSRGAVSGYATIILPRTPVLTVDALISATGLEVAAASVTVSESGVLSFPGPAGQHTVTWTAGRTRVPGDLYQALLELLRHLMLPQRGGASRTNQAAQTPGAAYAFPNRVTELIQPYLQRVGA